MKASKGGTRYYGARKFFRKPLYRLNRGDFLQLLQRYRGAERLLGLSRGRQNLYVCLYHTVGQLHWEDLSPLAAVLERFDVERLGLATELYQFSVIANVIGHALVRLNGGCFSSESHQAYQAKYRAAAKLVSDHQQIITLEVDPEHLHMIVIKLKHPIFYSDGLHIFMKSDKKVPN